MLTAGVAVDKATLDFDRLFSYILPPEMATVAKVGSIVLVPFGRGNKPRLGIVLSLKEEDDTKGLKKVLDLHNRDLTITDYTLKIIEHLKETTFCTWYDAVKAALPYGSLYKVKNGKLRRQMVRHTQEYYQAKEGFDRDSLKTDKQKAVFDLLRNEPMTRAEVVSVGAGGKSVLDRLVAAGRVYTTHADRDTMAYSHIKKCRGEVTLSPRQQRVFDDITTCADSKPHLIYGVTSSGKSMVFIKLIQQALDSGGSAMVLVPEISLTPQMIRLMREHFGDTVSVIHSRLSNTERLLQYNRARDGKSRVVVGTRSAVFTPMENLKLIVVDEEQEKSFKSENAPRYSAIRLAQFVSGLTGAKLVLASATPSIESFYLAQRGYYHLHTIEKRYADLPLPDVEIIDMSLQRTVGDRGPVSSVVLNYLARNKADGKQSIILINRRGYSTVGVCKECRQVLKCEDCSVNLVRHKHQDRLICHYCGRTYPVIDTCPVCGGEIAYYGYGTQHIEEYIQQAVPGVKILRMDADSTRAVGAHEDMLRAFGRGEYDILIGTQMVAKGLDFENVNMVCVLGIDSMLNHPSYNSNEQAFNLVTQVIGRAGRRRRGAKAVIQTFDGTNPVLKMAAKQDYLSFYESEIAFRKVNTYPPFCTMVTVAFTDPDEVAVARDSKTFLQIIKETVGGYGIPLTVLGPVPFDIAMVSKTYRWRLSIKCINNRRFREFLRRAIDIYLKNKENKSSLYVNINPQGE